jgi:hypothetical protein
MNAQIPRTTRNILVGILVLLIIGIIYFILTRPGTGIISSANPVFAGAVSYEKVNKYNGNIVSVSGYILIPNTNKTCLSLGWTTCRLWFDNDPYQAGFGLHEVLLPLGTGPNSITTDGKLTNNSGQLVDLMESEQFDWYHVTITGRVSSCKEDHCLILGDRVQGLK